MTGLVVIHFTALTYDAGHPLNRKHIVVSHLNDLCISRHVDGDPC
jgi:hypothetical protein